MLPQGALSTTPQTSFFLPPRQNIRFSAITGLTDSHMGGIAVGNASQGILYQLWTVQILADGNIYLSAPNTPQYKLLSPGNAVWVALALDQSSNLFVAWADVNGNCSYYWYDTTIPGYRTSQLSAEIVKRPFAVLDDPRPQESSNNDVIFAYVTGGNLCYRQQRDRFGTEYVLGAAPATLVQLGMNHVLRLQFAFQNVQGDNTVPPVEYFPPVDAGQKL